MTLALRVAACCLMMFWLAVPASAQWWQFRGPGGQGISQEKNLPLRWSSTENIAWKRDLPGPGASSPIIVGDRVFITCYSGYGLEPNEGDQAELRRHLLCINRKDGSILWHQQFEPKLPEHKYQGEGSYHGYAASTPASDGQHLYVFFGKSGVYCFDLDGNQRWHVTVGDRVNGWGSGSSPVLDGDRLLINASVESGSLVALDKRTGETQWQTKDIRSAWNTPMLVRVGETTEVVLSISDLVLGFDPATGQRLWQAEGVHRYVCPSVVSHDGIVYAIGGGHTSLAVTAGGEGDVTESHVVWRQTKGSNVGSPIYHEGHLYWAGDGSGIITCQDARTGETVYQERLQPRPGRIWASPILADGKLYFVSQHAGTFVVAARPQFELLAHNILEDDDSRTNASLAVSDGQLFLRSDRALYCIGTR